MASVFGSLMKNVAGVDQDVGAESSNSVHVEQAWILDEISRPRAAHMEFAAVAGRDGTGRQRTFEGLEVRAPPPRFADGEDVDRCVVAVALEGFDLTRVQPGHDQLPVPVAFADGPHFANSPTRNSVSASGPTLCGS